MYFENKLPYIIYIKFRIKKLSKMTEHSRIPWKLSMELNGIKHAIQRYIFVLRHTFFNDFSNTIYP